MLSWLNWIDKDQARYIFISESFLIIALLQAIAPLFWIRIERALSTSRATIVFLTTLALGLLASRWPPLFVREELNPDEAQMLSQALTFLHYPMPWLSYDGTTSGPLNTFILTLPAWIGIHPSFFSTRIIALILEYGAILCLFFTVRLIYGSVAARLAVLPPLVFFSTATIRDYLHYSSEHLPLFLGMLALYLATYAGMHGLQRRALWGAGFVCGLMPFAKLQSTPLALATGAVAACIVLFFNGISFGQRLRRLGEMGLASVAFAAVLLGLVAIRGLFNDFLISYVLSSLSYIGGDFMSITFLTEAPEFKAFFVPVSMAAVAATLVFGLVPNDRNPARRFAPLGAAIVLCGGIYAVYSPRHGSPHYLLFALMPLAGCAAAALGTALAYVDRARRLVPLPVARVVIGAVFVAVTLTPLQLFHRSPYPYIGWLEWQFVAPPDPVATMIKNHLEPGKRLAIWGWMPQYWVFTNTILGTRDSICQFVIYPNPYRDYYRARYLHDMEINHPDGFMDAVTEHSFGFYHREESGFETYPELAALIGRDYTFVQEVKGFRLYIRRKG